MPPFTGNGGGYPWYNWYNTNGEQGEEPPAEIKKLFELVDEWQTTKPGSTEYMSLGKEILKRNVEGLYAIGSVGLVPWPMLFKNNMENIPVTGFWAGEYQTTNPTMAEQWFFTD
jgi:peptide/nickel transport system substrate-binding protein